MLCRNSGNPSTARHGLSIDVAAALLRLPLLRQLDLSNSNFNDIGPVLITSLARLQDLRIETLGLCRSSAAGCAALPTLLMRLDLRQVTMIVDIGCDADEIAALRQLWHLQLQIIQGIANIRSSC
jgi:hypothetical protein